MDNNKANKIPAPLNEKDILSDGVFDLIFEGFYVNVNHNTVVGTIFDKPYMLRWSFGSNRVYLYDLDDVIENGNNHHSERLEKVIKENVEYINECSEEQRMFAEAISENGNINGIAFYWYADKF